jgi:hypothetical protein
MLVYKMHWQIPYHVICWKVILCVKLGHKMQMVNMEYSMLFRYSLIIQAFFISHYRT